MKLAYYINDGFVGNRSKTVIIHDDEIEECENEEEYAALIERCVQEHFEQNITYYYDAPDFKNIKKG